MILSKKRVWERLIYVSFPVHHRFEKVTQCLVQYSENWVTYVTRFSSFSRELDAASCLYVIGTSVLMPPHARRYFSLSVSRPVCGAMYQLLLHTDPLTPGQKPPYAFHALLVETPFSRLQILSRAGTLLPVLCSPEIALRANNLISAKSRIC